ncbi:IS21-like element helper ATPase IstB [Sphingobacterium zeae]|uniref:DNA replication protein DnaC n=2 Tax=Sphingobacterium TaxID=28453 RepID=A0ABU0U5S7_9SPHI|nr:IS21-like element helper ATPase IstB [Sphingobacterium zeae]MDQ1150322.1 DNA replication protein DnaC [Sphingobacterium zeae]
MDNQKQQVKQLCADFRLSAIAAGLDDILSGAENEQIGYLELLSRLFRAEQQHRRQRDESRRMKSASLPKNNDLSLYEAKCNGLTDKRLAALRELNWIDQLFNLVLMGPSGTGKTMLAAGLARDAVKAGYHVYFRTMEEIVSTLKTRDFVRSQAAEYKKMLRASLIVIDDVMLFPLEKNVAVAFFNFINQIYESTSIIVTTNKKPTEWAKMLEDEVIATALLDRILFRCEVINLTGESYRMQNRKTFLDK